MKRIAAWSCLALAAGLYYFENYIPEVSEYQVSSTKIPNDFDNYRIVQLSDLHCRSFGYNNLRIIHQVKSLKPDLILLTGDMVSRQDLNAKPFYNLVKGLAKKYPTYYVIGNHELDLTERQLSELYSTLRGYGVQVMQNDHIILTKGRSAVDLYGMYCPINFYKDKSGSYRKPDIFGIDEMRSLIGTVSSGRFSILMAHNPLFFPVYAEWNPDLVFSGHVHGGCVRLGKFGGIFSPGRTFFPKYYQGIYSEANTRMIVSRGLGGLRFFNRPEIVLAVLKREK